MVFEGILNVLISQRLYPKCQLISRNSLDLVCGGMDTNKGISLFKTLMSYELNKSLEVTELFVLQENSDFPSNDVFMAA